MKYEFKLENNEFLFGLTANDGIYMPFKAGFERDLNVWHAGNQAASIIYSTKGRLIYSKLPFKFTMKDGSFEIDSTEQIEFKKVGSSMKDAYKYLVEHYFINTHKIPDIEMFEKPQYNTWIEMPYECTEEKILKYANEILHNGFPAGVLMIDDCWCKDYGTWEFDPEKFKDPKGMVDKLHKLGFKVMVWCCPFVSPDSKEFRKLENLGYLVKNPDGTTFISHWWNGYSAVYDLSNKDAYKYFQNVLINLQNNFGIDGFKLDAGDPEYYRNDNVFQNSKVISDQATFLSKLGEDFPLSELRVGFNNGISPIANRLRDKNHSWDNEGINTLVMDGISLGLLGYPFLCPDMIGGGMVSSFETDNFRLDQELFVRYSTISALFPMMQFSLSPWKVLDEEHLLMVKKSLDLHEKYKNDIINEVYKTQDSGEPLIRHLAYEFGEKFAEVNDEFLLGDSILVCPMITKGENRKLVVPSSSWIDNNGNIFKEGVYDVTIPLGDILVLRKL